MDNSKKDKAAYYAKGFVQTLNAPFKVPRPVDNITVPSIDSSNPKSEASTLLLEIKDLCKQILEELKWPGSEDETEDTMDDEASDPEEDTDIEEEHDVPIGKSDAF